MRRKNFTMVRKATNYSSSFLAQLQSRMPQMTVCVNFLTALIF